MFAANSLASSSLSNSFFVKPNAVTKSSQMLLNVRICSFLNLGKKMSLLLPKIHANKHICPLSSGETKYRFTSHGAVSGCFFIILSSHPCGNEPFEKATFANRAVVTLNLEEYDIIISSIIRLLAPIILTGFAALSVETQKKCLGGYSEIRSSRCLAFMSLFSIRASTLYLSFSLRTCL